MVSRASVREYVSGVNVAVIAETETVNLTGLAETCRAYDAGRPYIVAEHREIREAMKRLCPGAKITGSVRKILERLGEGTLTVKVLESARMNSVHSLEVKRKCLEHDGGILFVFAEDEASLDGLDGIMGYLFAENAGLPLGVRVGISLDRFLGKR